MNPDGGEAVLLPRNVFLGQADFQRSGQDLVADDGAGPIVIEEFFKGPLPDLITPGGARLAGMTAARLAGVSFSGWNSFTPIGKS